MAEIGLFPLELVLLPQERVPLHIFEDRYRELIGDCLAEGRDFGLILENEDGLREVGTRTAVVELIDTFDDGRMNVLVEGRERFRVVELTEGRSYLTAEVEPLEDDGEVAASDEVDRRSVRVPAPGRSRGGGRDRRAATPRRRCSPSSWPAESTSATT